jgi:hypothetical protein
VRPDPAVCDTTAGLGERANYTLASLAGIRV